jgi:tetratricopeptide (TPR) repeat protein
LNSSNSEIATRYFLDHIDGARITGSRLHGVLLSIAAHRRPTLLQQDFLRRSGYHALLRFALGELDEEAFAAAAQMERATAIESVETKLRLRAEAIDRKNATVFAQMERKREHRRLYDRFGQPYIEREDFGRVTRILQSVANGEPIAEGDLVWLGSDGSDYWTPELRVAHHEALAKKLTDEWRQTGDVWHAINACGQWRKAERPKDGLSLAEKALERAHSPKPRSALLTTSGGALRDLGRYPEAVRNGTEAHSLTPRDFRPCTLLGAVHIEMGEIGTGAEWYREAEARGARREFIDREIQSILIAARPEERRRIIEELERLDPVRYRSLRLCPPLPSRRRSRTSSNRDDRPAP